MKSTNQATRLRIHDHVTLPSSLIYTLISNLLIQPSNRYLVKWPAVWMLNNNDDENREHYSISDTIHIPIFLYIFDL
jgi:hypothetical protein